jgi:hypothetical protein
MESSVSINPLGLGTRSVRKIGKFLEHYEVGTHPIGDEINSIAQRGEWLGQLSYLRNEITHAAPIGGRGLRDCTVRAHQLGEGVVPRLHYPLFGGDGKVFDDTLELDFKDEASARATINHYQAWSNCSVDALDYAWRVTDHLVKLLARVRIASEICGEMPTITDKDILGPVVFTPIR